MKVLITGSNGQLGSEIKELASDYENLECVFKDLPELDICDTEVLNMFIIDQHIDAVINCAGYTAVDKAEENPKIAEQVNAKGVLNLVNTLKKVDGKLIHISTDYVFDGNHSQPYKESDPTSPVGVYGQTKRAGELEVLNSSIDAIVIRTSWLYSAYGNNFVKTMLRLGNDKESIQVVFDQIGTATYAKDLAKTCLDILSDAGSTSISKKGSLYHYSNEGVTSWYDFARAIMEISNIDCNIIPIETKDYPTQARRPLYSVLDKSKITSDFKVIIPHWRDSLANCIKKINHNS
ncbi:dTDP-4-dehydrorhamnose reductase [Flavobacteriaceae bacterium]|nr:dTDP-4-dehydrorhamnose reductase [Flavobacteriaceae bacterium]MDB4256306.1 dTDP-4-dehydrorhamnose reductase [Flavobacteriaceae bacterium]